MRVSGTAVALLALGWSGLAGCGRHDAAPADAEGTRRPTVHVVPIADHLFRGDIEAPGEWKASHESVIQAPFDAIVGSISARPGDRVSKGERLGEWETYESEAAVRGAELLVEQARDSASAREARLALKDARATEVRVPIVAPVSGVVLRRQADEGARLGAGTELFALVANDALVFEARVPAQDRGQVKPGMSATLVSHSEPDRAARVWTLLPTAAGDQSELIWLRSENGSPAPEIGAFGNAIIASGRPSRSLAVPDSAVVEDDLTGRERVAVVDSSGRVKWLDVVLGPREATIRGISGPGVRAGLRVIVEDQRALVDGVAVSPIP